MGKTFEDKGTRSETEKRTDVFYQLLGLEDDIESQ